LLIDRVYNDNTTIVDEED